jgi:uncharacterized RDD family membrane protein YckC
MQCVRCSHPLPPRADRCLRCFALNPENAPQPLAVPVHDSGPARPVKMKISEPAPRPVALSFSDDVDVGKIDLHEAVTQPEDEQELDRERDRDYDRDYDHDHDVGIDYEQEHEHEIRAGPGSRLLAWTIDAALLSGLFAAHLYAATRIIDMPYLLEAILSHLPLWLALAGCLALAYSFFFTALGARTPGMALTRQRLQTLHGDPPSPATALLRAALSLASAPGLFGFVLALFDARGQTLHDKLCRCIVVISPPDG